MATNRIPIIQRIFEKSLTKALLVSWLGFTVKLRDCCKDWGLSRWQPIFEAIIILLIIFMPVLNSWVLLLPLLILLWLGSDGRENPVAKRLAIFWLALVISAIFSVGLKSGLADLANYSCWLGIAYLGGKVFSEEFNKKILVFLSCSCLLWIVIGLLQQWAGVPTPPGWLDPEQSRLIMVRSFSLFGNPNIYALYLLSLLVFTCYYLFQPLTCLIFRLWFILLLVLILISFYFTYSRFAWLLGITFLLLYFGSKLRKRRWLPLLLASLFLLALQGFRVRMATLLTLSDSSLWYRVHIWQGVIKAIADFWLWGGGPGSFPAVYPWYQIKDTISVHAHQIYLQIWLENGILSLAAFLWLIKKLIIDCLDNCKLTRYITSVIVVFLGYGLVESWSQNRLLGGYFWLFCGLLISSKCKEPVSE